MVQKKAVGKKKQKQNRNPNITFVWNLWSHRNQREVREKTLIQRSVKIYVLHRILIWFQHKDLEKKLLTQSLEKTT